MHSSHREVLEIREVQQPPLEGKNRREVHSTQNKADKRREVEQLHKLLVIAVHKQMRRKADHRMKQIHPWWMQQHPLQ